MIAVRRSGSGLTGLCAMSDSDDILPSWTDNAENWVRVVRAGAIPSRRAGTDAAIVEAVVKSAPARVLDIGCGEGWLVRAVQERRACQCVGVDGVADLIAAATAADPDGSYAVLTYQQIADGALSVFDPFDAIVFNFALLDQDCGLVLRAAAQALHDGGHVFVQTMHPGTATDGWRQETFDAFGQQDWRAMPYYFRSRASWEALFDAAGLAVAAVREVNDPATEAPLSLLFVCGRKD